MEELVRETPEPEDEVPPAPRATPLFPPRGPRPLEHSLAPEQSRDDPPPPMVSLSDELEELDVLGSGGAGVVTLARERATGRRVAVKRLRRSSLELARRFRREAETVASLDHPGIVRLLRTIEDDEDGLALVFELVEGPSLHELVRTEGRLAVVQALELGVQIADALAYAHERGVIHRDVKPTNVLLDKAGRARVVDFGLALQLEALSSITPTGAGPCGTWDYVAPEQWAEPHRADGRADIYGLGATLYRMLTGTSPRVIRESRLPAPTRALVLRAVEEDPADRFRDMRALAAALRSAHAAARQDASGVHTPLERISRQLREDLAEARAQRSGRRLVVAASGLAGLGILPPDAPRALQARLRVGAPFDDEVEVLVESVLATPHRSPRLLGDAHAVLVAALTPCSLGKAAREALRGLATASREPARGDVVIRMAEVLTRLARRGALGGEDLRRVARAGDPSDVLEQVLLRLRARARTCTGAEECRVHATRWRRALADLLAALPELAPRIQRELLAVQLEEAASEPKGEDDPM